MFIYNNVCVHVLFLFFLLDFMLLQNKVTTYFFLHHVHQPQDCYLVGFAYLCWLSGCHIIHLQLRQAKSQQQHSMIVKQVHTFRLASPESFPAYLRLRTWRGWCTQCIKTTRRGRKRDTNLLGFSAHTAHNGYFKGGYTVYLVYIPSPTNLQADFLLCSQYVPVKSILPTGLSFRNDELRKPLETMKVEILQ